MSNSSSFNKKKYMEQLFLSDIVSNEVFSIIKERSWTKSNFWAN
jgi:hypothetical protein